MKRCVCLSAQSPASSAEGFCKRFLSLSCQTRTKPEAQLCFLQRPFEENRTKPHKKRRILVHSLLTIPLYFLSQINNEAGTTPEHSCCDFLEVCCLVHSPGTGPCSSQSWVRSSFTTANCPTQKKQQQTVNLNLGQAVSLVCRSAVLLPQGDV